MLKAGNIRDHLKSDFYTLNLLQQVTSTNEIVKKYGVCGKSEGEVLIANSQTRGRGRLGREFYSPSDTGLYMSILLRPALSANDALLITTAAAVAVCRAIENVIDCAPKIKWVNDIFVNDKKICGILTESALSGTGKLEFAVLGIGLNLSSPKGDFPLELQKIAGTLNITDDFKKARLCAGILNEFYTLYQNIDKKTYLEDYRRRSLLNGKPIYIHKNGEKIKAEAVGVADDFSLIAEIGERVEHISTGEVSIRLR